MCVEDVAAFVFWTRNARPMLPDVLRLQEMGYAFYVQYTINGYPREIEHHSPEPEEAVATLRALSELVGPRRVVWRYDPIILSTVTPPEYHVERFSSLARQLQGAVRSAYVSFCDPYGKTRRHFSRMAQRFDWAFEFGTRSQHAEIAEQIADIASACGMQLYSCAEAGLEVPGVERGSCIDPVLLAELRPDLDFHLRAAPTREGCGCVQAVDIGAFDTCVFGCEYCYANNSLEQARQRAAEHDPSDSILWRPSCLRCVDLDAPGVSLEQKRPRIEPRSATQRALGL
jgi:DNA repair photolyase